jgi:hypothetical protein
MINITTTTSKLCVTLEAYINPTCTISSAALPHCQAVADTMATADCEGTLWVGGVSWE